MALHDTYMRAAGIDGLLRGQGESVTITPKRGQPLAMTALVGAESSREVQDERGKRRVRTRTFTITKNPDSEFGGMEDPQENAVLEYDGTDYAVSHRQDGVSYWELVCDLVGRSERSRRGLRTRE